jgi:TfoX/Sxy family transcriptional regulator of competence genes
MAYDHNLAARVREYLSEVEELHVEEKTMFGGLAFMINNKMCINVGDNQLMCRFDPELTEEIAARPGFVPMVMKGREYKGYCYVDSIGYKSKKDFEFWLNTCIDFNEKAKSSKKVKKAKKF